MKETSSEVFYIKKCPETFLSWRKMSLDIFYMKKMSRDVFFIFFHERNVFRRFFHNMIIVDAFWLAELKYPDRVKKFWSDLPSFWKSVKLTWVSPSSNWQFIELAVQIRSSILRFLLSLMSQCRNIGEWLIEAFYETLVVSFGFFRSNPTRTLLYREWSNSQYAF